jgi:hypothetical protein
MNKKLHHLDFSNQNWLRKIFGCYKENKFSERLNVSYGNL